MCGSCLCDSKAVMKDQQCVLLTVHVAPNALPQDGAVELGL